MIVWIIVLGVVLLGLIAVLAMAFARVNPTFLYIITIVMALLLLFVEIVMLGKSLYRQQWIMPLYIVITSIIAIVIGIAIMTGGNNGYKGRRPVKVEPVDNGRPPKTGHRASRGRTSRVDQSVSRTGRRGRR